MLDAFIGGLMINLQVKSFLYLLIGAGIGFWVGILPGLGGSTALALMIPFIYHMSPAEALPFLLGCHSVTATTGDITSVLFGIPGEPTTVATVVDGFPMAKKGEAGRALGAALMSSLIGAIIGAAFLACCIPIIRPLVLALSTPEMLMIVILGLTCISSMSVPGKRGLLLGLLSAFLGFLLSLVGTERQAGIARFTLEQPYLLGGINIVPVCVGVFGIPEVIDLYVRGTPIAGISSTGKLGKGVVDGIRDTFRYWGLTVRCGIIGSFIGLIPGMGGAVAQWVSYAHATQTAKTLEESAGFGKGDVRGVLGPGAANNSKEGACLIPTVAFGIPATTGMAVLMSALIILGFVPGPDMLGKNLTLTFSMVWTIALSNVVVVAVSLLFINHIAKLTTFRETLITPFIVLLCFIGAYMSSTAIGDLVLLLLFGALGYLMMRFGWSRATFTLGFVMGGLVENYFFISMSAFGLAWLYRPKVVVILLLTIAVAIYPYVKRRRLEAKGRGKSDAV